MKYKVLISDFDGTLVGLDSTPTEKVKETIKKLLDGGLKVCIATGRIYQAKVKEVCQELNLGDPQITSGGSRIIDPKTDKIIWEECMVKGDAKSLIDFLSKNNYPFAVESGEYVFSDDQIIRERYGSGLLFKSIKELDLSQVSKIFVPDISLVSTLKEMFPKVNVIVAGVSGRRALDITSKKASKELAVFQLSKILNIDTSEMIGIGDGYNDIPLLSACGYKVAMENAPDELKEMADLVVPTVENDGLVVAINKLLPSSY